MTFREIIRTAFGKPQVVTAPVSSGTPAKPAPSAPLRQSKPSEQEFKRTLAAAMAGNVEARRKVGILYYRGFGVRPNPPQAMKWLTLAAEQGDSKADEYLGLMQQAMTPEEIAAGQRLLARLKGMPERDFSGEDASFESPEELDERPGARSGDSVNPAWIPANDDSENIPTAGAEELVTASLEAEATGDSWSDSPWTPKSDAEANPEPERVSWVPVLVWLGLAAVVVAVGAGVFWLVSHPVKEIEILQEAEAPLAPPINMSMPLPRPPTRAEVPTPGVPQIPVATTPTTSPDSSSVPPEVQRILTEAQGGNLQAQFLCGLVYAEGKVVPADLTEAARWLLLAAERGHADAQNNLAIFYIRGMGVPKDLATAYKWMTLARTGGNRDAAANEEKLRKMLNPEELSRAQALIAQFSPKK